MVIRMSKAEVAELSDIPLQDGTSEFERTIKD